MHWDIPLFPCCISNVGRGPATAAHVSNTDYTCMCTYKHSSGQGLMQPWLNPWGTIAYLGIIVMTSDFQPASKFILQRWFWNNRFIWRQTFLICEGWMGMTIGKHRMDKCFVLILLLNSYKMQLSLWGGVIITCCSRKMWSVDFKISFPVFIPTKSFLIKSFLDYNSMMDLW